MLLKYGDCGITTLPPINRLELNDGTYIEIDDPREFCASGNTSTSITLISGGEEVSVVKPDVLGVYLVIPAEGISTNEYCRRLFYGYTRCTRFSLSWSGTAPSSAGNYCFAEMFRYCIITGSEITGFYIPTEITTVGEYFCYYMFSGCPRLISVPTEFKFPTWITSAGSYFMSRMFLNDTSLKNVPTFNIPNQVTSLPSFFVEQMFAGTGLEELPEGTTFPQTIESVASGVCVSMFEGTKLSKLPAGFNLPQRLPSGILPLNVFTRMFANTPIAGLPAGFNLPQYFNGISIDSSYFNEMFIDCPNLESNDQSEGTAIYFEYNSTNIFGGTTPAEPDSPTMGSTVYITDNTTA